MKGLSLRVIPQRANRGSTLGLLFWLLVLGLCALRTYPYFYLLVMSYEFNLIYAPLFSLKMNLAKMNLAGTARGYLLFPPNTLFKIPSASAISS